MANRSSNLREKYLDAERLFRKYWEMGDSRTINLLTEWATFEGMTSSRGDTPTPMGVWKAMWRWASLKENQHTAWMIMKDYVDITFQQWTWDMIHVKIPSAWQHTTNTKRDKFLRENGWI